MNAENDESLTAAAERIANACIGARLRMLNRIVSRVYDDALREYGIRFSQLNILTIIAVKGSVQPVEISRILALEKSTLSRNLRIMEGNGWLQTVDAASGNAQLLKLTRKGKALYRKAESAWSEAQRQTEELLGAKAANAIRSAVHSTPL